METNQEVKRGHIIEIKEKNIATYKRSLDIILNKTTAAIGFLVGFFLFFIEKINISSFSGASFIIFWSISFAFLLLNLLPVKAKVQPEPEIFFYDNGSYKLFQKSYFECLKKILINIEKVVIKRTTNFNYAVVFFILSIISFLINFYNV